MKLNASKREVQLLLNGRFFRDGLQEAPRVSIGMNYAKDVRYLGHLLSCTGGVMPKGKRRQAAMHCFCQTVRFGAAALTDVLKSR